MEKYGSTIQINKIKRRAIFDSESVDESPGRAITKAGIHIALDKLPNAQLKHPCYVCHEGTDVCEIIKCVEDH